MYSKKQHIARKTIITCLAFAGGMISTVLAAAVYDANVQSRANTIFDVIKNNASTMDQSDSTAYYNLVRLNIKSLVEVLTAVDGKILTEIGSTLPGLDDIDIIGELTGTGNIGSGNADPQCTMQYDPVCGEVSVQCITAPCPPIKETFSNSCMAMKKKAKNVTSGACIDTITTPTEESCIALEKELYYLNSVLACKATGASCSRVGKVLYGDTCVATCPDNQIAPAFTNICQETSVSCSAVGKVLSGTTCIDRPVVTIPVGEDFSPQCGPITKFTATKSLGGAFWRNGSESGSTNFTPGQLCDQNLMKGYVSDSIKDSLINMIDGDGSDGVLNWSCYGMSEGKKDTSKSINCSVTKINTRIVTDSDLGLPGTSQYPMYDSIAKWEAAGSHGTQSKTAICKILGYDTYTRGVGPNIECSIDGKIKSGAELSNIKVRIQNGEYEITSNGNEELWYDIKWGGILKPVYDLYLSKLGNTR